MILQGWVNLLRGGATIRVLAAKKLLRQVASEAYGHNPEAGLESLARLENNQPLWTLSRAPS